MSWKGFRIDQNMKRTTILSSNKYNNSRYSEVGYLAPVTRISEDASQDLDPGCEATMIWAPAPPPWQWTPRDSWARPHAKAASMKVRTTQEG